eukprot:CAMPEP_0198266722 /NCGR_PEP_ID=MMETSP1447-20131203/29733_1 /TAXON_ID=420782 /ORGANISM="Chaetoceros dichaeta, Strain CCMP1751" /LENGTH=97 /DNA_ID=CAMNT_0043956943 /DNA_START=248 /DNA_END=541 /DNA_ORIENTATION=+
MAIWSVVMIILPATKLPVEGGGNDMGGDNDNKTLAEEIALEIAGAALGLFSTSYYVVWVHVCDLSLDDGGVSLDTGLSGGLNVEHHSNEQVFGLMNN